MYSSHNTNIKLFYTVKKSCLQSPTAAWYIEGQRDKRKWVKKSIWDGQSSLKAASQMVLKVLRRNRTAFNDPWNTWVLTWYKSWSLWVKWNSSYWAVKYKITYVMRRVYHTYMASPKPVSPPTILEQWHITTQYIIKCRLKKNRSWLHKIVMAGMIWRTDKKTQSMYFRQHQNESHLLNPCLPEIEIKRTK